MRKSQRKEVLMSPFEIFVQGIGLLASLLIVLSFQVKNTKALLAWQIVANLCMTVHYLLLGTDSITAALVSLVSVARGVWFYLEKEKPRIWSIVTIESTYVLICALTFSGATSLLSTAAQLGSTYIFWQKRSIVVTKLFALLFISPLWLCHNILVISWGGIACESLNILLLLIFFIRRHLAMHGKLKNAELDG